MFRTLLDPVPFSLRHDTPTSPNRANPCAPQPGPLFGRFAEQSSHTDDEPLEAKVPRNHYKSRNKHMKIEDMFFEEIGVLQVLKVEGWWKKSN